MKRSLFENTMIDQLHQIVPITTRSMFGCVGVYSDKLFFALIKDPGVYFKVDALNRPDYEACGMGPFTPFANGKQIQSYYQVPDVIFSEPDILREWVEAALAAADRKKGDIGNND